MRRAIYIFLIAGMLPAVLSAQVEKNAMDYLLQHPRVSKRFANKHFGDRLFLEGGAGLTFSGTESTSDISVPTPGLMFNVAAGDWLTPEHGVRIGVEGGYFNKIGFRSKFGGISVDYLLNFTALCQYPEYEKAKPFEIYGVAGMNLYGVRNAGNNAFAWGTHLGLRGQLRLSDYTYLYVEPRAGLYSENLFRMDTWRKYRLAASLSAGVGYRLQGHRPGGEKYEDSGSFFDDMFFSIAGGPAALVGSSLSSVKDNLGARASISIGKWFDPYNGLRLGANAAVHRQKGESSNKVVGLGLEYMLNLHNLFGGYNPGRRFWIDALAGGAMSYSGCGVNKQKLSFGLSAAMQANCALNDNVNLFIEPRAEVHQEDFAQLSSSVGKWDVFPSAMLGVTFRNGRNTKRYMEEAEEFSRNGWEDHLFVEGSFGLRMPVTSHTINSPKEYIRYEGRAGIGKWLSPSSGARLWGEAGGMRTYSQTWNTISIGADYVWNVLNTFRGYKSDRHFEVDAALGFNVMRRTATRRFFPGFQAGLQGVWNINRTWGLFVEPQVRFYHKDFLALPGSAASIDGLASLSAGLRLNVSSSANPGGGRLAEDEVRNEAFVSGASGVSVHASHLRTACMYGPAERISYGRWINPFRAWRIHVTSRTHKGRKERFVRMAVGADYIADISALTRMYDPMRKVSLRAYTGVDMGVDKLKRSSAVFAPDIHFGGDVAFRISPELEIYVEPQLSYQFNNAFDSSLAGFVPSLMLGVNYKLPLKKKPEAADLLRL